jgi:hypothetical protein
MKEPFRFAEARKELIESVRDNIDFPFFMRVYAQHAGLLRYSAVKNSPFWIPTRDGPWIPAEGTFVESAARASRSFSLGDVASIFPVTGNGLPIEKIRVPVENLSDILLFMGIIVDDTRLQRIQEEFKAFLYISGDGWFSLQEIVLIASMAKIPV